METLTPLPPLKPSTSSPPELRTENDGDKTAAQQDEAPALGPSLSNLPTAMSGNLSAPSLQSPGITVEFHDHHAPVQQQGQGAPGALGRPPMAPHPRCVSVCVCGRYCFGIGVSQTSLECLHFYFWLYYCILLPMADENHYCIRTSPGKLSD